jgi:hypothetical protein
MIFTNEELQYEDENYLFQIVVKLIDKDPKRKALLKMINFLFVSSSFLKQFFEDFPLDEIDFDLFSSLKCRLFHDISKSDLLPTRRRRKTQNILSQQEIDEFFQIISSNFGENIHPVQQTKDLIKENQRMKQEIDKMKEIINSMRNDNSNI